MHRAKINLLVPRLILLTLLGSAISCSVDSQEADPALNGQWKLKAVLYDPGDGSGEFRDVDSEKIIEFFSNGNVQSNGNLCNGGITTSRPTSGTYNVPDSILQIDGCPQDVLVTRFRMDKGKLILSYPCIEPCEEKYIKLN